MLGRYLLPVACSEQTDTVFIGPEDAPSPATEREVFDPAGEWTLIHPHVPDVAPYPAGQDTAATDRPADAE